jgi:hypothetical protein
MGADHAIRRDVETHGWYAEPGNTRKARAAARAAFAMLWIRCAHDCPLQSVGIRFWGPLLLKFSNSIILNRHVEVVSDW